MTGSYGTESAVAWVLRRYRIDLTDYLGLQVSAGTGDAELAARMCDDAYAIVRVVGRVLRGLEAIQAEGRDRVTDIQHVMAAANAGDVARIVCPGQSTFDMVLFIRLAVLVTQVNTLVSSVDVMIQAFMPVRQPDGT